MKFTAHSQQRRFKFLVKVDVNHLLETKGFLPFQRKFLNRIISLFFSLARDLGDRFSFELSIKSCVIRSFLRSNGCHIKLHSKEIIVINIILKIFIAIRKKLIRLSRASASKSLLDILFTAKDYTQFHAVIQFIRGMIFPILVVIILL